MLWHTLSKIIFAFHCSSPFQQFLIALLPKCKKKKKNVAHQLPFCGSQSSRVYKVASFLYAGMFWGGLRSKLPFLHLIYHDFKMAPLRQTHFVIWVTWISSSNICPSFLFCSCHPKFIFFSRKWLLFLESLKHRPLLLTHKVIQMMKWAWWHHNTRSIHFYLHQDIACKFIRGRVWVATLHHTIHHLLPLPHASR